VRGAIWGGGGVRGPGALASPLLRLHSQAAPPLPTSPKQTPQAENDSTTAAIAQTITPQTSGIAARTMSAGELKPPEFPQLADDNVAVTARLRAVVFLQNRGCAERTPCGAHLAHCAMLYLTRKLVRRALYQEITHETYSKTRANSSRVYMEEFSVSHVDST
jgi:hypothetical protein